MEPATGHVNLSGKATIETVHVALGQYVDVWLDGVQVELRVLPNGNREIYSEDTKMRILSFTEWVANGP